MNNPIKALGLLILFFVSPLQAKGIFVSLGGGAYNSPMSSEGSSSGGIVNQAVDGYLGAVGQVVGAVFGTPASSSEECGDEGDCVSEASEGSPGIVNQVVDGYLGAIGQVIGGVFGTPSNSSSSAEEDEDVAEVTASVSIERNKCESAASTSEMAYCQCRSTCVGASSSLTPDIEACIKKGCGDGLGF